MIVGEGSLSVSLPSLTYSQHSQVVSVTTCSSVQHELLDKSSVQIFEIKHKHVRHCMGLGVCVIFKFFNLSLFSGENRISQHD